MKCKAWVLLVFPLMIGLSGCRPQINRAVRGGAVSCLMASANLTHYGDMPSEDYWHAVSRGIYPRISSLHKFGEAHDLGTTLETIWDGHNGGNYPFPTASEPIRIKAGGHSADTVAGSGAHGVLMMGLDGDGHAVSVDLATAGSAASASSTIDMFRVNRGWVTGVGIYGGSNIGSIIIEGATSGTTYAKIQALHSQTQMLVFTVPINHTAYISRLALQADSSKRMEAQLWIRHDAMAVSGSMRPAILAHSVAAVQVKQEIQAKTLYLPAPALTDMWINAKIDSGSAHVTGQLDMTIVRNY